MARCSPSPVTTWLAAVITTSLTAFLKAGGQGCGGKMEDEGDKMYNEVARLVPEQVFFRDGKRSLNSWLTGKLLEPTKLENHPQISDCYS